MGLIRPLTEKNILPSCSSISASYSNEMVLKGQWITQGGYHGVGGKFGPLHVLRGQRANGSAGAGQVMISQKHY